MRERSQVERDLTQKLQHEIGRVIEREINIAKHVLDTTELTLVLIQAAVSVNLTVAATAAASVAHDEDLDQIFDQTLAWIAQMSAGDRGRSIEQVRLKRSAAA